MSPIPKIPHTKISEIEEEACDVKPTQLTARLDPIKRALVKPNVYNIPIILPFRFHPIGNDLYILVTKL